MEASPPQEEEKKAPPAAAAGGGGEEKESPIAAAFAETERGGDAAAAAVVAAEVEFAACDCCGLTEECTPAYIAGVRERHGGRWICGLCAEAVQDEIRRAGILISPEEAMGRHTTFCRSFRSAAVHPAEQLIAAMRQLLRRSLESPRAVRSTPSSPRAKGEVPRSRLGRTGSGFPTPTPTPTLLGSEG